MTKITLRSLNESMIEIKQTVDGLTNSMETGLKRLEKKIDDKIDKKNDDLAIMIQNGFDNTATKDDFHYLNDRIDNLESKVDSLGIGQETLIKKVTSLEIGQEDITLKLDNYAYKFEVDELKKRATKTDGRLNRLESKTGLTPGSAKTK